MLNKYYFLDLESIPRNLLLHVLLLLFFGILNVLYCLYFFNILFNK